MTQAARPGTVQAPAAVRAFHGGLTFTELLIVVSIFLAIAGALMISLLVGRNSYVSADAYVQVQQEVRRALEQMIKELHAAGQVNNGVSIAEPGVQQLDFQLMLNYDAALCGGACWGSDDLLLPSGWIHYILDAVEGRVMRCVTANRLDAMPANFAGCRVLANSINSTLAASGFTYDHGNRIVTLKIQASITSQQLPGGSLGTAPIPLITRVRLRNP